MNILKINGQALEGIYVDAAISFNKPAKRVSTYSVPGRNGDLVIDEGTFDNVLITYPVFEKSTFPTEFDAIVNYLASLEGYQRIECSNDPQHFRLGRFVVPQTPTVKRLNRDGYYQLSFDCKPQRWLLSGEEDTEIDANPIDEYSGDIVSFDAVALDEITELKAAIEPVQDLNGQTSPYPAGGGVNKFDISAQAEAFLYANNGVVVSNANWRTSDFIPASQGNVTISFDTTSNAYYQVNFCAYDSNKAFIADSGVSYTASNVYSHTFAVPNGAAFVRFAYSVVVNSNPVARDNPRLSIGSADLGYAPYSNICPISGHTEVKVTRTGKNLFNPQKAITDSNSADVYIDGEWIRFITIGTARLQYAFTATGQMAFSAIVKSEVASSSSIAFDAIYSDGTSGMIARVLTTDTDEHIISGVTDANKTLVRIWSWWTSGKITYAKNIQLEFGSSATAYEPYAGQTYPISLGQTVYGGTLNVTTGVLTIDRAMVDLGTLGWTYNASGYFLSTSLGSLRKKGHGSPDSALISSAYKEAGDVTMANAPDFSIRGSYTDGGIYVKDSRYSDATAFKTAMSGVQLVYELAAPTTVQLTAAEVELLLGQNNIWADTGDVEVKVTSPTVFNNPSLFNSKPLIRVYGVGTFRVNDITVTIASHDKPYIDIDCELQECYCGSENMNEYVSFSGNDFPELQPGNNYMLLASGITKLDVTPRWWIL